MSEQHKERMELEFKSHCETLVMSGEVSDQCMLKFIYQMNVSDEFEFIIENHKKLFKLFMTSQQATFFEFVAYLFSENIDYRKRHFQAMFDIVSVEEKSKYDDYIE